ncbi:MAG: DNA repair protein RecN [Chthoniobacterales bacterium]
MLALLRIKNLALVDELEWHPKEGFIAITGETGAGKSIILGALKLLLGERTDRSIVRSGTDTCTVEAIYQIKATSAIKALLEEQAIEFDGDELILRRIITTNGASKQFVNGSPCNLGFLRQLGELLVDLHGPHDHQSLFSRDEQMRLLDSYAGCGATEQDYQKVRKVVTTLKNDRETLFGSEQASKREQEMLAHQIREIGTAELKPDEEDGLLQRYRVGSHGKRLQELAGESVALLNESENSVLAQLSNIAKPLKEMAKLDSNLESLLNQHASAIEQIEELSSEISSYVSRLELNPQQLKTLEERVDLIQNLKRKYGNSISEILAYLDDVTARLETMEHREEKLAALDAEIAEAKKSLSKIGKKLSDARKAAAPKLAKAIASHLRDLGFLKSEFSISFEALTEGGPGGFETAEFLFAPNPGEPPAALRSIASSGEISRVMLAVKSALAEQDQIPILVFDEIDANVGGEIANGVGEKMRELGKHHQVFCITHLPQVAAAAGSQFVVTKEVDSGRSISTLQEVIGETREQEIARMLGGKKPSAVAHAKALLGA